jgi:hypothetical protein
VSYTHNVEYRRKYKFDSFDFKVPEFIELFKEKAEKWVIEENAERKKRIAELTDTTQLSKKEIIEYEKYIKKSPQYYGPVTIKDYVHWAAWQCRFQVIIDPVDGSFNITVKTQMNYMDKLQKGLKRKQEQGGQNENRVTPAA